MISITMWTKDISFFFQVVRQAKEEKFLENVCLLLKEKKNICGQSKEKESIVKVLQSLQRAVEDSEQEL